ncbi:MAG: hypothetical protein V1682_05335 [Candidatus Omnitrophota bacterium]
MRAIVNRTKIVSYIMLTALCVGAILIALPSIDRNIDDPNMVAYFNHDEGYLMDMAWRYYSGQKLPSYQYEGDYGLELVYAAAFARAVLSKFMDVRPGTFVLLVRFLHLLAWVAALLSLWNLVMRHFGRTWQAFAVTALLDIKLATIYLVNAMKPDPLVTFFMIVGVDYAMRIIGDRPRRWLTLAAACASCAFILKFSGIFLLPMIVAAMCLYSKYGSKAGAAFPRLKAAWAFPAVCGMILLALPAAIIFLYRRRLTNTTWYEEFGFIGSLMRNDAILYIMAAGLLAILLSFVCLALRKARPGWLHRIGETFDEINSASMTASAAFGIFFLVFGFGWVLDPKHFLELYAITGREAFGYAQAAGAVSHVWGMNAVTNFFNNVRLFDTAIFFLFFLYLALEFGVRIRRTDAERQLFHKRAAMIVFLLPYSLYMCSGGRVALQHTLPFFVVMAILALEGARILFEMLAPRRSLAVASIAVVACVFAVTVAQDSRAMMAVAAQKDHQGEDIVFDIARWWRTNYPAGTRIVAAHPTRVYLPPEYKNVKFLRFQLDEAAQLEDLIADLKPELVYYNARPGDKPELPPIEIMAPDADAELAASFDNTGRAYARYPEARFVVYRMRYN